MSPPIIHQRHTDPDAARARVRNALRDNDGSVPLAAEALGCSAAWLRAWRRADPQLTEGVAMRARGWPKGKPRAKDP